MSIMKHNGLTKCQTGSETSHISQEGLSVCLSVCLSFNRITQKLLIKSLL